MLLSGGHEIFRYEISQNFLNIYGFFGDIRNVRKDMSQK